MVVGYKNMAGIEFCPENLQKSFQDGHASGLLTKAIRDHWCEFVPKVYSAHMLPDATKEERLAQKVLLRPIERFLCGGDPDVVLKQLKDLDHPPQLCGKVFKVGEPTYACRDCGMDPTCVLCIECFQNSSHKKHRYKMATSGGGGYCDCGDKEAWRESAFCDIHQQGAEETHAEHDPVALLPKDLHARAEAVFMACMTYVAEMLTWEDVSDLPSDLQQATKSNTHVCMLFNDEVHTYEQVIGTLQKAVDCSQKEAIDFATTVDREGRSNVKVGTFLDCNKAREIIERHTTRLTTHPLKVKVMHCSVVAHQQFAMRIVQWLKTIIDSSAGLRKLFCLLSMKPVADGSSIIEKMLLADTLLWKVARVQCHQLFMTGVLMDQECKKMFAVIYTLVYSRLYDGFVEDDHDHAICAVSDSVQIFTVPTLLYPRLVENFVADDHKRSVCITSQSVQIFTVSYLARMLISEYNLLQVIIEAFKKHCQPKINKDGKFSFDRGDRSSMPYRRAQYTLYDLKYALVCKPSADEWTPALRENYINGFKALLGLLKFMQGMDAVTRQSGQHIEFEPEWEGAFNLQLKLAENITIMLDWCGLDREVLVDAYATTIELITTIKMLAEQHNPQQNKRVEVAGHRVDCIVYDISSQPVSIHIPVTRMLAGLYPHLTTYNINLNKLHTRRSVSMVELMEMPLRVLVMIAQSQAGMWRRNGYSLLNQIYFYTNVRCRTEMYDKDILMLQACAAAIPPDDFIIHLLNKFGLLNWIKSTYDEPFRQESGHEDIVRQVVVVVQEFLNLLIILIGERYVVGVGEVASASEAVKREIVHQLCIQPMAHSELCRMLTEDVSFDEIVVEENHVDILESEPYHETGIEDAVSEVAVFKKPKDAMSKGMYELKPEYYKDYNPFFYHYTRADQSKSEEAQRKRRKESKEPLCLPPPLPPRFSPNFQPITQLLSCDVMLHIMRTVLQRTIAKRSKSWSDTQFEKVLHLIGLALHEESRSPQHPQASPEGDNRDFIQKATAIGPDGHSLLSLLEAAPDNAMVAQNKSLIDLLHWVIRLLRELIAARAGTTDDGSVPMETTCEPDASTTDRLEKAKKKRADLAEKRRAKIMNKFLKMQKNFIKDNAEQFESTSTELAAGGQAAEVQDVRLDPALASYPVALGPRRTDLGGMGAAKPRVETCILCQEEQEILHTNSAMVLAAFVQKSTVLSKNRSRQVENFAEYDPLFQPADMFLGAYTSTCGHTMHAECWQKYYDNIMQKERRRNQRLRHMTSYDVEKNEFLCPLCETLSNTVIPMMPHLNTLLNDRESSEVHLSLNDWLDGLTRTVKSSIKQAKDEETDEEEWLFVPCPLSSVTKMMAESVAKNFQLLFDYMYDEASATFHDKVTEMLRKFATDAYAIGLGVNPDDENTRVPIMAWQTCAFTITNTEQELRHEGKPLSGALSQRASDCVSSLVRFAACCTQVINQDVVKRHCVSLLSALLCERDDQHLAEPPCILDMDVFHYMVSVCLSLPTLYAEDGETGVVASKLTRIPNGGLNDLHVLQWMYTAHVVQVMLAADFDNQECMETETDSEGEALMVWFLKLRTLAGLSVAVPPSPWQLYLYMKEACLPFLRCAALFFHYLTDVRFPEEFAEIPACLSQYEPLCRYLSLPCTPSSLFNNGHILVQQIENWCSDRVVRERLASTSAATSIVRYPRTVNQLVSLPLDYSELINSVSTFTCPKSDGDDSRAPTMCLVCGEMLCSQSYCCQVDLDNLKVGAATAHAHRCGAGTALFLRVRECQVLLLTGRSKGCFYAPPYLDDYGETDQGLRRGNPLHLSEEAHKKLQKLWLSHSIPEKIAHELEHNTNLMTIEWQHL